MVSIELQSTGLNFIMNASEKEKFANIFCKKIVQNVNIMWKNGDFHFLSLLHFWMSSMRILSKIIILNSETISSFRLRNNHQYFVVDILQEFCSVFPFHTIIVPHFNFVRTFFSSSEINLHLSPII